MLVGQLLHIKSRPAEKFRVELRLDRPDADVVPVRRLVGVVPGPPAIEQVCAALVRPGVAGERAMEECDQRVHAVDDGGIHYLAFPGRAGFE